MGMMRMSKALFSKMLAVSTALMLFAGLMTGCTLVGKLLSEKDTGT